MLKLLTPLKYIEMNIKKGSKTGLKPLLGAKNSNLRKNRKKRENYGHFPG